MPAHIIYFWKLLPRLCETACAVAAAAAADTDTGHASQALMTIKNGKSSPEGFPSFEGKIPDVTLN
jgi:hypothetical protein